MSKRAELVGEQFYDLRVIEFAGVSETKPVQSLWKCQCVCGGERVVPISWLRSGAAKHCGCKTHRAKTVKAGEIYGSFTVLRPAKKTCYWLCRCICGKEVSVYQSNLISGKSTACLKCGHYRKNPGESSFNRLYRDYQRQAQKRRIDFCLSEGSFKQLVISDCYYCGKPPLQDAHSERSHGSFFYNGIDRVDNAIGYSPENCVPCCGICNHMKHTLPHSAFIQHVERIHNHISLRATGERIVVETSISNPIVLTSAS
jgi:hypothetical protein